jgi:hypothetical protein
MTAKVRGNKYFDKVKKIIAWVKSGPISSQYGEYNYAIEKVDEYLEAFFDTSPFSTGDRVVFREDKPERASEGWRGLPLLFRRGSPATVGEIDFQRDRGWIANFSFDYIYHNSKHEGAPTGKTSGYIKVSVPRPSDKTWLVMNQNNFVLMEEFDGEILKAPWDGCKCVGGTPGDRVLCKAEGCKVWCWHHHGECSVHPDSIAYTK